jgi:mRNA degradation ribonuclease J1/J2
MPHMAGVKPLEAVRAIEKERFRVVRVEEGGSIIILSEGLATLALTITSSGATPRVIHPTLLWDDENVILVDTGVPGQLQAIREAMDKLGVPFRRLDKVIITHQDVDHIGSLPEVVKALTVADGQLSGPRAEVTQDMATATASIEKFTHFDIATVICYHGGVFEKDADQRLAALAISGGAD